MSDNIVNVPSFLDEDLSKVDTNMPVIQGPITEEVEVQSIELAKSKEGSMDMVKITVKTLRDLPSTKKQIINAGFPLYGNISITPLLGREGKKDRTEEMIKRDVARFVQACGENGGLQPLTRFVGKRCLIEITIRPKEGKWAETNDIQFIKRG